MARRRQPWQDYTKNLQRTQGAQLAAHREAHWCVRWRRPDGTLPARRPSSPSDGAVLDVPAWLLHREPGELPAIRHAQWLLIMS